MNIVDYDPYLTTGEHISHQYQDRNELLINESIRMFGFVLINDRSCHCPHILSCLQDIMITVQIDVLFLHI